jgi:hypothetical protein
MITPREMLRDYMTVLNILMQNPEVTFDRVVGEAVTLKPEGADPEDAWEPTAAERKEEGTAEKSRFSPDDLDF